MFMAAAVLAGLVISTTPVIAKTWARAYVGDTCQSGFSTVKFDIDNDRYYDDLGAGGSLIPGENRDVNTWCMYGYGDDPANCIESIEKIEVAGNTDEGAPDCVKYTTGKRRYSFEKLTEEVTSCCVQGCWDDPERALTRNPDDTPTMPGVP